MIRWLRSLFAWTPVINSGAWIYFENEVTGRRKACWSGGGYQPIDHEFMRNGDIVVGPRGRYVIGSANEIYLGLFFVFAFTLAWSCVMSSTETNAAYRQSSIARHAGYRTIPQWPAGRQLALFSLARTETTRAVADALKAKSTARASQRDYGFLIASGIASKQTSGRNQFLVLDRGWRIEADNHARNLARDLDLHIFKEIPNRFSVALYCTCGWSCSLSRNEGHVTGHAMWAKGRHIEAVKNGSFRPVADAMNKIVERMAREIGENHADA